MTEHDVYVNFRFAAASLESAIDKTMGADIPSVTAPKNLNTALVLLGTDSDATKEDSNRPGKRIEAIEKAPLRIASPARACWIMDGILTSQWSE
jgi:hypothetical protein